jgi:oxygen-independent coproporphyrinogen-3 oxidase
MVRARTVSPKPADEEAEYYEFTMEFLEGCGFEHYEVSNYAKPGRRSRHNYNYWRHVNYLGFGPSAHSYWRGNDGTSRRWCNVASISEYCARLDKNKLPLLSEEILTERQLANERIFLGLRSDGLNLNLLYRDFHSVTPRHHNFIIPALLENGTVSLKNGVLRLTQSGYLLCDEICTQLLP